MSEKPFTATIVVATHKKYRMPKDPLYLPLHVGAEGKRDAKGNPLDFGYQKDNEGDNISLKNPRYCELTGIYWAWKNLDSDYLGLVHYRRYFGGRNRGKDLFDSILTSEELEPMLGKYEVFVPRERRYMIETLYSHYAHTHYAEHLDTTRTVLSEKYPEYILIFTAHGCLISWRNSRTGSTTVCWMRLKDACTEGSVRLSLTSGLTDRSPPVRSAPHRSKSFLLFILKK